MNVCNNMLVYSDGLKEITEVYRHFTAEPVDFEEIAHSKKLNVEQEALGSDVNRLASLFVLICENNRDRRDYTRRRSGGRCARWLRAFDLQNLRGIGARPD